MEERLSRNPEERPRANFSTADQKSSITLSASACSRIQELKFTISNKQENCFLIWRNLLVFIGTSFAQCE